MAVAALDIGDVRVGLAISDDLGVMAHPRPPLDGKNLDKLLEVLRNLIREERINRFVVGYPLDQRGRPGPAARKIRRSARQIANGMGLPIELVDERLTTVQAHRRMLEGGLNGRERRGRVDGAAASIILQTWLDSRTKQNP